jgi:hypothetical protein
VIICPRFTRTASSAGEHCGDDAGVEGSNPSLSIPRRTRRVHAYLGGDQPRKFPVSRVRPHERSTGGCNPRCGANSIEASPLCTLHLGLTWFRSGEIRLQFTHRLRHLNRTSHNWRRNTRDPRVGSIPRRRRRPGNGARQRRRHSPSRGRTRIGLKASAGSTLGACEQNA